MADLKEFQYSDESQDFLQKIKDTPEGKKISFLIDESKNNKDTVLLDGFHSLLKEALNSDSLTLDLPDDFIPLIIKKIESNKTYFGYDHLESFLDFLQNDGAKAFPENRKDEIFLVFQVTLESLQSVEEKKPLFEFPDEFDESLLEKLKQIGEKVHTAYQKVKEHQKIMQDAESKLVKFQKKDPEISQDDVLNAKKKFNESKPVYMESAQLVSEDMAWVYHLYMKFSDDLMIHKVYNLYLAKLLASQEARHPVEQYVLKIAEEDFNYETKEFQVTEDDERMGKTLAQIISNYQADLVLVSNRLEGRYQKRQIMARLKQGEHQGKLIYQLKKIIEKDPDDIKTYILIARLTADLFWKIKEHIKRLETRQDALAYCEDAYSKIDTYLDLQGITEISHRDHIRVGFIKTISGIRNPLVK